MPPPLVPAEFPVKEQPITVTVPPLKMPPPSITRAPGCFR